MERVCSARLTYLVRIAHPRFGIGAGSGRGKTLRERDGVGIRCSTSLTMIALLLLSPTRIPFFLYRGSYGDAVRRSMVRPCLARRCRPFLRYCPYIPCHPFAQCRPYARDRRDVLRHRLVLYHPFVLVVRPALAPPVLRPVQPVPA